MQFTHFANCKSTQFLRFGLCSTNPVLIHFYGQE